MISSLCMTIFIKMKINHHLDPASSPPLLRHAACLHLLHPSHGQVVINQLVNLGYLMCIEINHSCHGRIVNEFMNDGDRRGDDNDEKYHLSIIYHLTVSKLIMMTIPIMIISISIFDLSIVGSRCRTLSNSPFIFGH